MNKPYVLMILDGVGINSNENGNAFKNAYKPNIDKLMEMYPYTQIKTSGIAVGLPEGQMGNSEVGHTNLGAGRIVYQDLVRINNDIKTGKIFENKAFLSAINHVKQNNSALHLMGVVSDGGVHSELNHLFALLDIAKVNCIEQVYVHCFTDGRDTSPTSGIGFVKSLQAKMKEIGLGKIATVVGRYYAMDRDNIYERTKLAYDLLVNGIGRQTRNISSTMNDMYEQGITDEFLTPIINLDENKKMHTIKEKDAVIFFNFRADRTRQITRALKDPEFNEFDRKLINNLKYICMTEFDSDFSNFEDVEVAYGMEPVKNNLGEYLSSLGLKQLRIAETQKYAHVTFFLNGGKEKQYEGEDRILVPSSKVATFDMKPEMSARQITKEVINVVRDEKYDVIIINYANGDMVGHSGDYAASIKAVEVLDECIQKVVDEVLSKKGAVIITADHGNVEQLIDYNTGGIFTQHTTFDVPFIIVSDNKDIKLEEYGIGALCDVSPTLLDLMDIEKPKEMTGESLIIKTK